MSQSELTDIDTLLLIWKCKYAETDRTYLEFLLCPTLSNGMFNELKFINLSHLVSFFAVVSFYPNTTRFSNTCFQTTHYISLHSLEGQHLKNVQDFGEGERKCIEQNLGLTFPGRNISVPHCCVLIIRLFSAQPSSSSAASQYAAHNKSMLGNFIMKLKFFSYFYFWTQRHLIFLL